LDSITRSQIDDVFSTDREMQSKAYYALIEATNQSVDWAYAVWDDMVKALTHKDNHVRSIAAQLLSNLAKSDPEQRILKDFDALLAVTKDERFVTARHCMQSLWKIGVVSKLHQDRLVAGLGGRYHECITEKNGGLIRSDILQSLRNVYDVVKDEAIRTKALALIESENDPKYRKKYTGLWKVK